ncbi:uncharacterized protein BDW43DRAFT_96961 [Aspergillus alliaceus]|uniref:uncharacterized protein n=1 Tax=Petromyces alliaceus TaxID=209559 RepID=UPI0012A48023|nr:uncharacterized protein BDW43DRAFT_96961 [Aspergillus alliaceus]KAB8232871.1 hypothetical protein BDW43DRAFT_96961 [Aspergillus alliaceus]
MNTYFRGPTRVHIGLNQSLFDFTESASAMHMPYLASSADQTPSRPAIAADRWRHSGCEALFITNDQSRYFRDFMRPLWRYYVNTTYLDQVGLTAQLETLFLAVLSMNLCHASCHRHSIGSIRSLIC